ncbi:MAG: hypothetical protein AAGC74_11040 [Verrucomicrobiota bacterium]
MADSPRKLQRSFVCPSCQKEIFIPYDLPPTTAPCPSCGDLVTSPALEVEEAPPQEEVVVRLEATEEPRVEVQARPEPAVEKREGGVLKGVALVLGVLLLLGLIAVTGIVFLGKGDVEARVKPEDAQEDLSKSDDEGERVLQGFLAASSVEERVSFVIGGESLGEKMHLFYEESGFSEADTPFEVFTRIPLVPRDEERGMSLMVYDRPEHYDIGEFFRPVVSPRVVLGLEKPDAMVMSEATVTNFLSEQMRVMAYLIDDGEGPKLDWEIFVQTKYRLLRKFVDHPERGKRGTFRVTVQEDVGMQQKEREGYAIYRFSDPAHVSDHGKVLIADESELGRVLAPLKWRGKALGRFPSRNATVVLGWSDEEEPVLRLDGLVCWEFLGLGGETGNWRDGDECGDCGDCDATGDGGVVGGEAFGSGMF